MQVVLTGTPDSSISVLQVGGISVSGDDERTLAYRNCLECDWVASAIVSTNIATNDRVYIFQIVTFLIQTPIYKWNARTTTFKKLMLDHYNCRLFKVKFSSLDVNE